ncbi:MAG: hypothetical protein P8J27_07270 [Mariniblastus sp.]|nr:hypothetical protein [Mariniblastus sp.]
MRYFQFTFLGGQTQTIMTGANVSKDINVVALVKGEERYIFLFNDEKKSETLRTLGKYASDSKLSFSWYDAAVLSQKVRTIEKADAETIPEPMNSRFQYPAVEDQFSGEDLFSGDDVL